MLSRIGKRIPKAILTVFLLLFLLSCRGRTSVLDYVGKNADGVLIFPSEYGEVSTSFRRTDGEITLEVISPERSAGTSVFLTANSCTLTAEEADNGITMSDAVSEKLKSVFALLYRNDGEETVSRSENGEDTLVRYTNGTVTLGTDLLPKEVTLASDGGDWTIQIKDYRYTGEE